MQPDPIVVEIRAIRDRLAAQFNDDIGALIKVAHVYRAQPPAIPIDAYRVFLLFISASRVPVFETSPRGQCSP